MFMTITTTQKDEMIDITNLIRQQIRTENFKDGFAFIFVPHTTAAVTINENADPDVVRDVTTILGKLIPWKDNYHHLEGNSAAHMKSILVGASQWIRVENGMPILGTWQSVFFCEFDGPRKRKVMINLVPSMM